MHEPTHVSIRAQSHFPCSLLCVYFLFYIYFFYIVCFIRVMMSEVSLYPRVIAITGNIYPQSEVYVSSSRNVRSLSHARRNRRSRWQVQVAFFPPYLWHSWKWPRSETTCVWPRIKLKNTIKSNQIECLLCDRRYFQTFYFYSRQLTTRPLKSFQRSSLQKEKERKKKKRPEFSGWEVY